MTMDDHNFDSRVEQADLIDDDVTSGYTQEYKSDLLKHVEEERKMKQRYDSAWADTNEATVDRRVERKRTYVELGDEARRVFGTQRTLTCGKNHGILLYDEKRMDDRTDRHLRWWENFKHRRIMKKYNTKFMRERVRTRVQGPLGGHGVFTYDKKGPDCSKLYIEQVYVNGNGVVYDILIRCGNETMHATPEKLRQWESEGYTVMNPEKLY